MIAFDKEKFRDLIPTLMGADINTLFAISVLEGKVEGSIFVDNNVTPASFYIKHPYGMALLYGESAKEDFYKKLKSYLLNSNHTRKKLEWLQVYPDTLYKKMDDLLENHLIKKDPEGAYSPPSPEETSKVLEYQRINFTFQKEKYAAFKKNLSHKDMEIVSTSENIFNQLDGNVAPKYFWNNFQDFNKYGVGFTLLINNKIPASTAFASFVFDHKLEIGIETNVDYRGSGYATMVCVRLIDYCLENGLEPVWSCSSGNIGSRKLAWKLGFEERKKIPYYILPALQ